VANLWTAARVNATLCLKSIFNITLQSTPNFPPSSSFFEVLQTNILHDSHACYMANAIHTPYSITPSRVQLASSTLFVCCKNSELRTWLLMASAPASALAYHTAVGGVFGAVPALFDCKRLYLVKPGAERASHSKAGLPASVENTG
jgi:hypothetical protein